MPETKEELVSAKNAGSAIPNETAPIDLEARMDRFVAACRKAGVKVTHQRTEIFREVASSESHPDAEAVYNGVRARVPSVSLDTVYRTLWLLADLGLLFTLGPRRESVRFDANLTPHHHYVCTTCGLTRDFRSDALDALEVPADVAGFGTVAGTHVEIRGTCRACAENDGKGERPAQSAALS